ncbi:MAG TPA: hypothetical protein VK436_13180 [Methanocella sp.]|nr:hypothetical protein [Methanocella sp.]
MSEPTAIESLRYAGLRTRQLLFPFGVRRWISFYRGLTGRRIPDDSAVIELRRLRNYYKGTRILTKIALLAVIVGFILPFTVVFAGMGGFFVLLVGYVVLLILFSGVSLGLEMVLDPVFALQHEDGSSFGVAAGGFIRLVRKRPMLAGGYMVIKLIVDMFLVTMILAIFMPALVLSMALMLWMIKVVPTGADVRSAAGSGLIAIVALILLGLGVAALVTVAAAAFYGYFNERSVKMMRE